MTKLFVELRNRSTLITMFNIKYKDLIQVLLPFIAQ